MEQITLYALRVVHFNEVRESDTGDNVEAILEAPTLFTDRQAARQAARAEALRIADMLDYNQIDAEQIVADELGDWHWSPSVDVLGRITDETSSESLGLGIRITELEVLS